MSERTARMRLEGMRFFGRIGHTEEEREVGTHVEVDVELLIPLEEGPAHSLSRTVDYREVHDRIDELIDDGEHPLLEGLAEEILDAIEGIGWREATVRVRKKAPPISGTMRHAEIELERTAEP